MRWGVEGGVNGLGKEIEMEVGRLIRIETDDLGSALLR